MIAEDGCLKRAVMIPAGENGPVEVGGCSAVEMLKAIDNKEAQKCVFYKMCKSKTRNRCLIKKSESIYKLNII